MIALLIAAYLVCGFLTAVIYRKFIGDSGELETGVTICIWPVLVLAFVSSMICSLLSRLVDYVSDLIKL